MTAHHPLTNDADGNVPVLIVDDHELVGTSLMLSLKAGGLAAHWCSARGAAGILAEAASLRPGLVLLDLDLGLDPNGGRVDGVHLVGPLLDTGWRVLVLSGSSDRTRVGAALAAGALAWVPKNAPFPTLLAAVHEALAGRPVMAPARRNELIELYEQRTLRHRELAEKVGRLTQREREVLALLARGKRAQAVADQFVVSLSTVRTQIRAILSKLEVGSQLEAVALYRRAHGS
jgi:DNA-binding NarL/FixJ family response regulator